MEFGKLPSLSGVSFSLPPDPPGNAALFEKLPPRTGKPKAFIGATGWSMKEWLGKIYPKTAKPADFLHHYARQFNTIELNATHYRIPDALTVQHWRNETAPDFKFCPKIPQAISHSADLDAGGALVRQFCEAVAGLEEKLGCCLLQLPPYFGAERLGVLEVFLKNFPLPLAVEARHEGWFSKSGNFSRLFDLLEKCGVSTVITDVAGRRDVCHARLTTDTVLVRFVGNNLHPSDFTRLDAWAERLGGWFGRGLRQAFFFTHEPDNLLAPDLAVHLFEKLEKMGGVESRAPVFLNQEAPGKQMSLFL